MVTNFGLIFFLLHENRKTKCRRADWGTKFYLFLIFFSFTKLLTIQRQLLICLIVVHIWRLNYFIYQKVKIGKYRRNRGNPVSFKTKNRKFRFSKSTGSNNPNVNARDTDIGTMRIVCGEDATELATTLAVHCTAYLPHTVMIRLLLDREMYLSKQCR